MSCSSDSDEEQNQTPEFDRSTILKNYAENIIIPRYDAVSYTHLTLPTIQPV